MGKRTSARKTHAAEKPPRTPAQLQGDLARLDRELVLLANQRAATTAQLLDRHGAEEASGPSLDPNCDAVQGAISQNKGPLRQQCLQRIFCELLSGIQAARQPLRVAYLGPEYSYSHLAALERFGHSADLAPVANIAAVFEEVHRGQATYGLAPLENSTDGRIADTLEMFTRLPTKICGEVQLPIHHTLLGKCRRNDITEVYSKPQALSQCRNWLARHVPQARPIEVTSTSTAAQIAKDKPGAAAIASLEAGRHYGLDVLAEAIEDDPANRTRFAVIGRHSAPRTGDDKTALMCDLLHKPGALADALQTFKKHKLNLTWIESFPFPAQPGRYFFFLEMMGHESDPAVRKAVAELEPQTRRLVILGAYPRATLSE